ncbi:MAG: peptidoglycan-associated lipoprotein [Desulfobacteraceae bacterium IS3]|nr:MAG: peptidoglycan-associated lipoprotein [Desulfobacteraceae bacterium IS3]
MKRRLMMVLALVLIVPGLLMTAACSKKAVKSDAALTQGGGDTGRTIGKDKKGTGSDSGIGGTGTGDTMRGAAADRFVNEDVTFAYDSSALDARAQEILKFKTEFLRSNANAAVTIEGHCDERGTSEYNMALGQKRADSVKKFLINSGISGSRMNTVSFGKERALDPGHNEAAWSKNRRAHFVLQ